MFTHVAPCKSVTLADQYDKSAHMPLSTIYIIEKETVIDERTTTTKTARRRVRGLSPNSDEDLPVPVHRFTPKDQNRWSYGSYRQEVTFECSGYALKHSKEHCEILLRKFLRPLFS